MLTDLNTYLNKAIPDTRLTIKKYLDVKFEYLVSRPWPLGCGCGPGRLGLEPAWRFVPLQLAAWRPAGQGQDLGDT